MKSIILLIALFLVNSLVFAQKSYSVTSRKAIKYYEQGMNLINGHTPDRKRDFDGGTAYLKKALKVAPDFIEVHVQLAQSAFLFQQFKDQEYHYSEVVRIAPSNEKYVRIYFLYGDLLMRHKRYEEAIKEFTRIEKFPKVNKKYYRDAVRLKANCEYAIVAMKDPYDLDLVMLDKATVNRFLFQSHPILTGDEEQMIYSARASAHRHADENIVISTKKDNVWQRSTSISDQINTNQNEGFACISSNGKMLIFTSCDRVGGIGSCDLYVSYKEGEKWGKPENLGPKVNCGDWDSEPALSADGRTLYFSSNRKGGYGGRDIWYSKLNEDGEWGQAHNLGGTVNTVKDEVTPFMHFDGIHLYFASSGHIGLGGYDIFVSEKKGTKWSIPQNLGYPLNTEHNEGSLFITPDYRKGYFEKYQKEGINSHAEIFEFDYPPKLKPKFKCSYAKGIVYDKKTKQPIKATVELINLDSKETDQLVDSDAKNGEYLVMLTEGREYALSVQKEGYLFYSDHFDYTSHSTSPQALNVYLEPIQKNTHIALQNIFFETNKYNLKDKSFIELNKVVQLLTKNPSIKLEISGHTDNIGNDSTNLTLSQNRAKAVYNYLIEKGIVKSRLIHKGMGEKNPIADNNTEAGRSKNRRIEIKVL